MNEKKQPGKKTAGVRAAKSGGAAGTSSSASTSTGRAKKSAAGTESAGGSARARAVRDSVPSPTPKKKAAKKGGASLPPPAPAAKLSVNDLRREAAKKTAIEIATAALDKKAERVEIVDIGEKVDYADYLVVMTGRSDRQVVSIAQGIEESLKQKGQRIVGREGLPEGHWVLLDFGDAIVHIFLDEARKYYDLEGLWMDAPRVPTPQFVSAGASIPPPGEG